MKVKDVVGVVAAVLIGQIGLMMTLTSPEDPVSIVAWPLIYGGVCSLAMWLLLEGMDL